MNIQQVAAWIAAGQTLIAAGAATVAQVRGWLMSSQSGLSEADLNAILSTIITGATLHQALADADAGSTTKTGGKK